MDGEIYPEELYAVESSSGSDFSVTPESLVTQWLLLHFTDGRLEAEFQAWYAARRRVWDAVSCASLFFLWLLMYYSDDTRLAEALPATQWTGLYHLYFFVWNTLVPNVYPQSWSTYRQVVHLCYYLLTAGCFCIVWAPGLQASMAPPVLCTPVLRYTMCNPMVLLTAVLRPKIGHLVPLQPVLIAMTAGLHSTVCQVCHAQPSFWVVGGVDVDCSYWYMCCSAIGGLALTAVLYYGEVRGRKQFVDDVTSF